MSGPQGAQIYCGKWGAYFRLPIALPSALNTYTHLHIHRTYIGVAVFAMLCVSIRIFSYLCVCIQNIMQNIHNIVDFNWDE